MMGTSVDEGTWRELRHNFEKGLSMSDAHRSEYSESLHEGGHCG